MTVWVIRYRYPGTTNGQPVGLVYAVECTGPAFTPGTWSYAKAPEDATRFDTREDAETVARTKHWPEATAVEL